jgi:putative peptidoglycan lipid II flippase
MSKRHLIKSTGIIGFATAASRVLGFVRDIVIAGFFGTAVYAQAFVVAFRIPNLLRDLVGEGAMNSAIVPVLTEELAKKGKKPFFRLAQVVFNIMFLGLLGLTLAGIFASPLIVKLIAPGFIADPEKFRVTVTLTRALFPFLFLVGLWAYAMGVLNSLGKFASAAFGSCFLNLAMILSAVMFGENVFGLACGVLSGGVLQLLVQLPSLYSSGWKARLTGEYRHPQAKKIGKLLIPRVIGTCIYQFNVFISTIIASLSSIVGEGAVAAMYYAGRIWQLPLAVFGIALAQAALPTMSRHAAREDMVKMKEILQFSLKMVFLVLIPSTIGIMMLSRPITKVLFERGSFTAYSTSITSSALFFFTLGLVACGGLKVLANAFYALGDTKTPIRAAFYSAIMNLILSVVLMWPLKVGGLTLANSIAAALNFILLYIFLVNKIGDFGTTEIKDSFLRVTAATCVMAFAIKICLILLGGYTVVSLCVTIFTGATAFGAASVIFGVKEVKGPLAWLRKKI